MLSIIVSVIFFGMMLIQIFIFLKLYKLVNLLGAKNIKISHWSRYAAIKDLKKIINSNNEDDVKIMSAKTIYLMRFSDRILFGSIGLIIFIFILNAFFKWKQ